MKPFATLTGQEKAIELFRWLLVPVALATTFAVLVLIGKVALPAAMAQPPGAPPPLAPVIPRTIVFRALAVIMVLTTVLAGAKTAPRHRVVVAIVLAGLWIAHAFLYRILVHIGRGTPHYLDFAIAVLVAGGAVALIYFAEKSKQRVGGEPRT